MKLILSFCLILSHAWAASPCDVNFETPAGRSLHYRFPMTSIRHTLQSGFARAIFALTSVYSVGAVAQDCTLLTSNKSFENIPAWTRLGYRVVERKDLATLNAPERAALLTDHQFAVTRGTFGDQMQLSLTNGRYVPGWTPISFKAPAPGTVPNSRYTCALLMARLPFYRESRAAVADVLAVVEGRPIGRAIGDAVLDLERSYLVQKGDVQFERNDRHASYRTLLEQIKPFAAGPEDFFARWFKVRRLVYLQRQAGVGYAAADAVMTTALIGTKEVNCVGETYLLASLYLDGKFTPPLGWTFAVQFLANHIRPVLYNAGTGKVLDLVTGGISTKKGAIANIGALYRQLWLGHDRLRFNGEATRVAQTPIKYYHRDLICALIPKIDLGRRRQAATFTGVSACGSFPGAAPDHASNESKTKDVTFDEDSFYANAKSDSESKANAEGGRSGDGPSGFWSQAGSFFGSMLANKGSDLERKALARVIENVVGSERPLFSAALADMSRANFDRIAAKYSGAAIAADLGFAQLEVDAAGDRLSNYPLIIKYQPDDARKKSEDAFAVTSTVPNDTAIYQNYDDLTVITADRSLYERMIGQPSIERRRIMIELVGRPLVAATKNMRAFGRAEPDLDRWLDEVTKPESLAALHRLGMAMTTTEIGIKRMSGFSQRLLGEVSWRIIDRDVHLDAVSDGAFEILERLLAEPAAVLKWMSKDANRARLVFNGTDSLSEHLQVLMRAAKNNPILEERMKRWTYVNEAGVAAHFLFNVLKHPRYFFTVEAEPNELTAVRPIYPMQISDARVRDLKQDRRDPSLPKVNLWPMAGTSCPANVRGLHLVNGIYLDCGRGEEGDQNPDASDRREQTGVRGGWVDGRPTGAKPGDADQTRAGVLRGRTAGTDDAGQLPLQHPLSPERQAYARSEHATDIRDGRSGEVQVGESVASVDPRTEVHLPLSTWFALLRNTQARALDQPVIKILMHHAYRNRLSPVYAVEGTGLLRVIRETDLVPPDLISTSEDSEFSLDVATLRKENAAASARSEYEGLDDEPFFRAALANARAPKFGHLLITRAERVMGDDYNAVHAEIDAVVASVLKGEGAGRILPGVHSYGPLREILFGSRRTERKSWLMQFTGSMVRTPLEARDRKRYMFGLTEIRGGLFSPFRRVYYRYAESKRGSRREAMEAALDDVAHGTGPRQKKPADTIRDLLDGNNLQIR